MTRLVPVLLSVTCLFGARPTAPTIDDALAFAVPSTPRISPDGTRIVYQVSRTNQKDNAFEGDLWLVDVATPHNARILPAGPGWNGDPQWSPDGQQIAFIGDRSGKRQIFVLSPLEGEPRKLTRAEEGVNEFRWAPDGKSIAFTSDNPEDDPMFEVVKADATLTRLWRIDVDGATPAKEFAFERKDSVADFAWSPDGSRIAFQAAGIYTLDLSSGAVSTVAAGAGPYRNPVWSPDGKYVAFETAGGDPGFYYANWYIARAPANGGDTEPLTKAFDENADLISWTPAGIYFGALERTASQLFVVDPSTRTIRRITKPGNTANLQFSLTPDGSRFAFVRAQAQGLAEIFGGGLESAPVQLTEHSAAAAKFQFAPREVVRWKSGDGTEIEGVLLKPADFDPAKKYPLLVVIHGGPIAVDQPVVKPDRNYPLEQFVAKGALVLRPNYRGSAGYGAKLRALAVRNLGTGDAADIVSGVDSLIAKGFVDPDRVGAMGWSEGGYVAAFLATATNRFRAVSVGAGVSDWMTYYVNTDITPFTRQYLKATPWDDPEIYRKASPITYVKQANTPVLIQHGDMDRRVPIPNAYELRQALEDRKVPVRMIVYKGFGHSIDRPKQQRAVMEHNLEWFSEWILDAKGPGKTASPEKQAAPVTVSETRAIRVAGDSPQ